MVPLILLFSSLYLSTVMGDIEDYIVGGIPTVIEKFPFQVGIIKKDNTLHGAGSVITEKFVLTAAHCICFIPEPPITDYHIFVGATNYSGKGQTHPIEHTICHSGYTTKFQVHDIGLIGIKDKFIFNKYVKPINILKRDIPVGTMLTVTGWGFTNFPGGPIDILKMLEVPVISQKSCRKAKKEKDDPTTIEDTHLCTFSKVKEGTCLGDSGGPVSIKGVLVGLVSRGEPCAIGYPDVHTKISKYVKWIKTNIDTYCKTRTCPVKKYPTFVAKIRRSC